MTQRWLFARGLRLRVKDYDELSPPAVGGVLYSAQEMRSDVPLAQALAGARPWVCLGLLEAQPWTRRARVSLERWLQGRAWS